MERRETAVSFPAMQRSCNGLAGSIERFAQREAMSSPNQVYFRVREQFAKLGVAPQEIAAMSESPVVTTTEEVACIYRAGNMIALWDIARATLKFYDYRAQLLLTCSDSDGSSDLPL